MSTSSTNKIKAWSYSRLDTFETCPYRAKLEYIDRVPKPELVPPPGKDEHPLERGNRVHAAAEHYITREINLIPELELLADDFVAAKARYREKPGLCVVEEEWAFDEDWRQTGWSSDTAWGRLKLDLGLVSDDARKMRVVDVKTGKKYAGKHVQQGQLYAAVSFLRYPDVEEIDTEFWYVDSGEKTKKTYKKIHGEIFRDAFDQRAKLMTNATSFPPKSSAYACRFCPYGEGRDGNKYCEYRFSFES